MKRIKHTGWGRTHSSFSKCYDLGEVNQAFFIENKTGLAIGLGRSYGDSSVTTNGVYIKLDGKKKIELNSNEMTVTCSADVSIGDLERTSIKENLFPWTVPGTEFVSIGGAIASNVHGKSHHVHGAFGNSVLEISLLKSNNELVKLYPYGETANFFWATVGGMGLTGLIMEAKIKLYPIETAYVDIYETRARNLNELLKLVNEFDQKYLFTVAWLDLSGNYSGKGIVSGANHTSIKSLSRRQQRHPNKIIQPRKLFLPSIFPSWFVSRIMVRGFNFLWYWKPLSKGTKHIQKFLHPLDAVTNWNEIYGTKGFVQFQFQVPDQQIEFISSILNLMKDYEVVSFLGVLKKFGNEDESLIGFPSPGWTLAVDIPAERTDFINELKIQISTLIEKHGKVYLTKDSIMNQTQFRAMYPKYSQWMAAKKALDPMGFWQSDQGRRLGLC